MCPEAEYALLCPVQRLWTVQSVAVQHYGAGAGMHNTPCLWQGGAAQRCAALACLA